MHKMKTRPDKVCGSNRILIFSDIISVFMHVKSWKLNLKKKKKKPNLFKISSKRELHNTELLRGLRMLVRERPELCWKESRTN